MPLSFEEISALREVPNDTVLETAIRMLRGRLAVTSSFGAESALLLSMVAEIDPSTPVLFLNTLRHFPETLRYRDELVAHLGLKDVHDVMPRSEMLAQRDPQDQLAAFDPDACCALRKTEPLFDTLSHYDAWVTGRKRGQAASRSDMEVVEPQPDGRARINPLSNWSRADIEQEIRRRNLPRHPLTGFGFASIGCAPCTRAVRPGEDPRAGRWAGHVKTECGIHLTPADRSTV